MLKNFAIQTLCLTFLILSVLWTLADASDDDADNSQDPTVVILFMFFGLGLGIIVMQIISVFGEVIPYTVVVFIIGIICSVASRSNGAFGESISQWVSIDAEVVLFAFLPPLLFGEAMNLNWYHVKGGLLQSIILAGPGVIIGAVAMGAITKVVLPYHWGWNLCMTFGSILSATDPVAVVALLKGANASPKLTILKVGESLLNDGTSMVLFTIFFNALNGEHYNAGSILSFFLAACIGSVALGVGFGLVAVRWMRSANRPLRDTDVTIQIAITITCAYLVFFTAQFSLDISGALACCGAGAVLAWLGPPIILNHETMHNVWGMMEWVLNTLVFLLTGLIIGHRVINSVKAIDWLYLIVLYLIMMVLRFAVMALLYPWISNIGHKCTKNEAIFMSWAGLRGALCMTLALIVEKGGPPEMESETSRLFFFTGGIAALTLLVNATTAQQLLVWLDLLGQDSPEKIIVMTQIKKKLKQKLDKVVDHMAVQFSFTPGDMKEVRRACSLLNEPTSEEVARESEYQVDTLVEVSSQSDLVGMAGNRGGSDDKKGGVNRRKSRALSSKRRARTNSAGSSSHSMAAHSKAAHISRLLTMSSRGPNPTLIPDLLGHVRAIFLEIVKVQYWNHIEAGKLPRLSRSAQYLLYSVEVGLDQVKDPLGARDWACLADEIKITPIHIRFLTWLEKFIPIACNVSHVVGHLEATKEKRSVYMLTSFIEAHQHAQKKIHAFIGLDEDDEEGPQTPEEIRVVQESESAVAEAQELLAAMSVESVAAIRSKQAACLVLAQEAEIVKNMLKEGLITNMHAEEFLEEISEDAAKIEKERNTMYNEQAKERGQRRRDRVVEEEDIRRSLMTRDSMVRESMI